MRTKTPPSPTAQQIGPLLANWHINLCDSEDHSEVRWYTAAIFDHDWEQHILVKQWHKTGGVFTHAGYSLWFITCDDMAIFVDEWPLATGAPLIAASAYVMGWEALANIYNEGDYHDSV